MPAGADGPSGSQSLTFAGNCPWAISPQSVEKKEKCSDCCHYSPELAMGNFPRTAAKQLIRPISARYMHQKEIENYERQKGSEA
jgi:hypothetical protein